MLGKNALALVAQCIADERISGRSGRLPQGQVERPDHGVRAGRNLLSCRGDAFDRDGADRRRQSIERYITDGELVRGDVIHNGLARRHHQG